MQNGIGIAPAKRRKWAYSLQPTRDRRKRLAPIFHSMGCVEAKALSGIVKCLPERLVTRVRKPKEHEEHCKDDGASNRAPRRFRTLVLADLSS